MTAGPKSLLPQLALTGCLLGLALAPVEGEPGELIRVLREDGKNRSDLDRMEHGYYEQLLATGPRVEANTEAPPPLPFKEGPLALQVPDYRECVLKPDLSIVYKHGRWTNNSLGLRDREYTVEKPPGTYRIVMLGDSIGVGWGLDDGQGFEPRLEGALDGRSRAGGGTSVEILNLSVPGYAPGQRVEHLNRVGWSLGPDLILYEATAADLAWDERRLRILLPQGIGGDVPMLQRVLKQAGLDQERDAERVASRLRPYRRELVRAVYQHLGEEARSRGVPVVWVLIPRVGRTIERSERSELIGMAREAGFDLVIDLSDAFEGLDPEGLAVAPDDYHPNAEGHSRMAVRLEEALAAPATARRFGWPWAVPAAVSDAKPGAEGRSR